MEPDTDWGLQIKCGGSRRADGRAVGVWAKPGPIDGPPAPASHAAPNCTIDRIEELIEEVTSILQVDPPPCTTLVQAPPN